MNVYQIDAAYRPFPSFAEWSELTVDVARWEKAVSMLPPAESVSSQDLAQAHRIAMRAAAVDTGAIEGLYEVDRGFTMTIALQTAAWEAVLDARGEKVRSLIESQMRAYDYVLDLATGRAPVSEMWIRQLHERITASQDTYPVLTEIGWQDHPLPKGKYKAMPNHVRLPDGGFHAYAPVDQVPVEMHRLVEEIRGEPFQRAHPVLQAAYAHYALVAIHPFADGNGRVARALASTFTYRSHSVPLLILLEHKPGYFAALRRADAGAAQAFVDFVFERTLDAIALIEQTLKAAAAPDPEMEVARLLEALRSSTGDSDEEVDAAGLALLSIFAEEFQRIGESLEVPGQVEIRIRPTSLPPARRNSTRPGYRHTHERNGLTIGIAAAPPLGAKVGRGLTIEVPIGARPEDEVLLANRMEVVFKAPIRELVPVPSTSLLIRLRVVARRIVGELLAELSRRQALL